jgi:S-phase kinase-associated protein 1
MNFHKFIRKMSLESLESVNQVNIISKENESFTITKEVANLSELFKTILEDEKENNITLKLVSSQYLTKVVEFMNYYSTNPFNEIQKPLKSCNLQDILSDWYISFLDIDNDTLFELISVANYLDIKPLLDLTCVKVASMIKGKDTSEITKTFRINLKPEEEQMIDTNYF